MKKRDKKLIWFKIETTSHVNYFMLVPIVRYYGKFISRQGGGGYFKKILWIFERGTAILCYPRENFDKGVRFIFQKTINNPAWALKINKELVDYTRKYLNFSRKLENKNFSKLSDVALADIFVKLIKAQNDSHTSGQAITWLIDADQQLFTNYLLAVLNKRAGASGIKLNLASVFALLTTPEKPSFVDQEAGESLKIALIIKKDRAAKNIFLQNDSASVISELNKIERTLKNKILSHYKKYRWLHYTYEGPVLALDYFIQIWQELIKEDKIANLIKKNDGRLIKVIKARADLFKRLDFSKKERQLFNIAKDIVWLKGWRKDCMYFGAYVLDKIAVEIGRRLNLSLKQVRMFCDWEITDALLKNKFNPDELNRRREFSVIYSISDGWPKIYSGNNGKKYLAGLKFEKEKIVKAEQLTGVCACPGKAKGVVKIVESVEDIKKMNKGDILLSETTYPALLPAMKIAGAIITNIGGLTCHAAIVSRELGIPCVIGTKIATKVLRDGDLVEVDADKGVVRIIKK